MKKIFYSLLMSLALSTPALAAGVSTGEGVVRGMEQASLDGEWDFQLNGGAWSKIKVPGNWEMQGFATPKYAKNLVKSTAIYRRSFRVPSSWKNQLARITFDGVNYGYTFSINGQEIGTFHSSYTRRSFDITKYVSFDKDNTIEVRVETHPRGYLFDVNDDWSLSGISRPVYLSTVPQNHIEDFTLTTSLQGNDALVTVKSEVVANPKTKAHVEGEILDAKGNVVGKINETLRNAHLWTAETPYLYTLRLRLMSKKKTLHLVQRKFGIRQVSWDQATLKVNGTPIKLKGVNHHDISPLYGRAITDAELMEDMKLMKKANINAIRMSHYPPSERLIELCDSMGMYVIDEVPYGFGDEWLGKNEYLPDLKERAYYTLLRDKNHPSVIIWSVGNENPVTRIGLETGKYVYKTDPTRPYLFPQTHKPFYKMFTADYDSVTMYSLHYPVPNELKKVARETRHPVMHTEYAHAQGLDFGQMQEVVDRWYQHPQLAGGCVWMLFDQGLLRKSEKPVDKNSYTPYAWVDEHTYYDTFDDYGADGILYANRLPQADYWQVRKVYSPVIMQMRNYKSGTVWMRVINRYDFTDLKDIHIDWTLKTNNQAIKHGTLCLACAPHDTTNVKIEGCRISADEIAWLELKATDASGKVVTEQNFRLDSMTPEGIAEALAVRPVAPKWDKQLWLSFLKDNVYARVGKKRGMSETAAEKVVRKLWPRNILPVSNISVLSANKDSIVYDCTFDCDTAGYVSGTIAVARGQKGETRIHYSLTPHGKGEIVEAGLSIRMPNASTARWIGQGPYACYPGKNKLDEYGVWQLNAEDVYFPGNREKVYLMMLSDDKGGGTILCPGNNAANIALERYGGTVFVSHNTAVSKPYNKANRPSYVKLKGNPMEGSFSLMDISADWSEQMIRLWGTPSHKPESYAPFYHSYDQ